MKQIKITATLEYDDEAMHGDDADAQQWFRDMVLGGELHVFSEEVGDIFAEMKGLEVCE